MIYFRPAMPVKTKNLKSKTSNSPEGPLKAPYLSGIKIYLTPFTRQHLENPKYLAWMNDLSLTSNLVISDYLMPVTFEQLEEYYSKNGLTRNGVFFAIHEKCTDEFIGTAKLAHIDWLTRSAEFGRVIGDEEARGKGYGTEIIALILDYAFLTLNLNKVSAGTHADNKAALKTYQKFNFQIEGRIRQACYKDGKLIDTIRVGILRSEWDKSKS